MKAPNVVHGQPCSVCGKKTLTLMEDEHDIPFFGACFLLSMNCSNCHYHKADIEAKERHDPVKFTIDIKGDEDMKIRVVKSAEATLKIPHLITMQGGEVGNGFITNIEGVLERARKAIEFARDNEEDDAIKKKAKNQLKKIMRILWGKDPTKIILEDPSGNSAIISDKAKKSKL
ncbi:ZPR1 zinc finger domain-containing protein [Candidatus Woesearchaeota archaeon]|nr:ZPR1 zinc finger domain-containing protein [Candidatus Woesearchaeota archaeon]